MHGDTHDAPLTTIASIEAGAWLAGSLPRRGKARRVHFYPDGEQLSICMRSHCRPPQALRFDLDTGRTEFDPKLNSPQYRTPCALCTAVLAEDPDAEDLPAGDLPDGEMLISSRMLEPDIAYPVRITRAMGTRDGCARFAVAEGRTSGRHLEWVVSLFTATAESVQFVGSRRPRM